MEYLDSNVFIYAFLNQEEQGKKCRLKLKRIRLGNEQAATSMLTFDEVFWKVKKERGQELAIRAAEVILTMPNLMLLEVNAEVAWRALNLIKLYHLDPRDAIHAACALNKGISVMVSEDHDFDTIKEMKRIFL